MLSPQARVCDWLNRPVAQRLFAAHLGKTGRHGSVLWSLLVLARWVDRGLAYARSLPPK